MKGTWSFVVDWIIYTLLTFLRSDVSKNILSCSTYNWLSWQQTQNKLWLSMLYFRIRGHSANTSFKLAESKHWKTKFVYKVNLLLIFNFKQGIHIGGGVNGGGISTITCMHPFGHCSESIWYLSLSADWSLVIYQRQTFKLWWIVTHVSWFIIFEF